MDVKETVHASAVKLAIDLTDNSSDKQVLDTLHETCKAYSTQQTTLSRFQLIVGRVLVVIRERKLFREQYKTFDRYMLAEVIDKYGISRATVWTGLQIAQMVPEITIEDATKIGVVNMRDIARAVKHEEAKFTHPQDKPKLVDKLAKQAIKASTNQDFRKSLEAAGLLQPRTSPQRTNTIVVRTTPELVAAWTELVGDRNPDEVLAELVARATHKAKPATKRAIAA